ncbi:MAG: hypothetical protein HQL63_12480 [Magnetococcales bacterium]|nr:hypothetical protein [Magnetococcales bacterium]MBF0322175.1 hypothetical protein [Magnetococcales bacterium]
MKIAIFPHVDHTVTLAGDANSHLEMLEGSEIMRHTSKILLGLAVAGMAAAPSVQAETKAGDFTVTSNVSLTSDYVWRGISQTDRDPALQGGFKVSHDLGLYVGVWGSNVDFDGGAPAVDGGLPHLEVDINGGFAKEFSNGMSVDVGYLHYAYPGSAARMGSAFGEYYLGLGYKIAGVGLTTKYSFSPDFSGAADAAGNLVGSQSASYVEGQADYEFPEKIKASAHYGYSFGDYFKIPSSSKGYGDYRIGLSREFVGLDFGVNLYGTDGDGKNYALPRLTKDRVVLSVSKTF